jgi:hypothetical protein
LQDRLVRRGRHSDRCAFARRCCSLCRRENEHFSPVSLPSQTCSRNRIVSWEDAVVREGVGAQNCTARIVLFRLLAPLQRPLVVVTSTIKPGRPLKPSAFCLFSVLQSYDLSIQRMEHVRPEEVPWTRAPPSGAAGRHKHGAAFKPFRLNRVIQSRHAFAALPKRQLHRSSTTSPTAQALPTRPLAGLALSGARTMKEQPNGTAI